MTTSYSFRSSVLESEKTYCLTEDGITIAVDGTTTDLIPYQELRSMNLQFNGRFNDLSRYRCVVRTANRKLALTNGHYVSLGILKVEMLSTTASSMNCIFDCIPLQIKYNVLRER